MPHSYQPFAETPAIAALGQQLASKSSLSQKAGFLLIGRALTRRGPSRIIFLLAGAALCWRAYRKNRRVMR